MKSWDEWSPVITMVATEFAFATVNILLKKVVDNGMNHLVIITYRQSISTIFLAPIGYFSERNSRPKLAFRVLCLLFLSAIVGASLTQYFFLLGIQYTSATFSCAFINMVSVITFIMALPFGLEKVNIKARSGRAKVVGTLVCLGGVMILSLYKGIPLVKYPHSRAAVRSMDQVVKLSSANRKENWTIGSMSLIAGTLLWSSWFLLQSNIAKRYPCQYSSTAIMSFFATLQSAVLGFSLERNLSVWLPKGKMELFSVIYAGMVGSGLGYVGMSWCVKKRGPVFTAAFSPFIQIFAAMLDIPFLHEQLRIGSLLGSVTVIAGLYILLWGKSMEMKSYVNKVGQGTQGRTEQEPALQVTTVNCDSGINP